MVIKTFNLDKEIYEEYSKHCKKEGLSMSKRVERFIGEDLAKLKGSLNVEAKKEIPVNEENIQKVVGHHSMKRYCG
ncbi:MAG: hypothetical protein AABW79_02750 [Nanoarchaeota archaeon]